jgi:hypothetical protein
MTIAGVEHIIGSRRTNSLNEKYSKKHYVPGELEKMQ